MPEEFYLAYIDILACSIVEVLLKIVGDTVSDFGLPWDLLAEIDFLV